MIELHLEISCKRPVATVNSNIAELGQVFTPDEVVAFMLSLRQHNGRELEPSCGNGAFLRHLGSDATGIEIDESIINDPRMVGCDFFEFEPGLLFDTIIGNPPYVRFRDIKDTTKGLLQMEKFDQRSNLYLFFIDRCIDLLSDNGELIFITPREFIKATSARLLNKRLFYEGSFTHFYDLGDQPIFSGVSPNCAIWRWQKGRRSKKLIHSKSDYLRYRNGQLWFGDSGDSIVNDWFEVKVGAVSGADECFEHSDGEEFVCSRTAYTGETKRMIYNTMHPHPDLEPHKERLLRRKVKKFDESNWWKWGREFCRREGPRIYVNCKTRKHDAFFVNENTAYDGSVLALFPKDDIDLDRAVDRLNSVSWRSLGFECDGRKIFSQRGLSNAAFSL